MKKEYHHCYKQIIELVETVTRCNFDGLFGKQPFSSVKRYLKTVSPALWEDSERMEAEVRMTGVVFLAALYCTFLSALAIIHRFAAAQTLQMRGWWCFFILSAIVTLILGRNFRRMRRREVGYTYMNALLAWHREQRRDASVQGPAAHIHSDHLR